MHVKMYCIANKQCTAPVSVVVSRVYAVLRKVLILDASAANHAFQMASDIMAMLQQLQVHDREFRGTGWAELCV